jgi:hypothetical protein
MHTLNKIFGIAILSMVGLFQASVAAAPVTLDLKMLISGMGRP